MTMSYQMLINGTLTDGTDSIGVINPANESVVAQCPVASTEQLNDAVAAAQLAFQSWKNTSFAERAEKIAAMNAAIAANADELAAILVQEQGKPLEAAQAEVMFSQMFAEHFASMSTEPSVLMETEDQRVEIHRRPLGVVAGICPGTSPLLITVYKLAPALMMGNTIIIKPAPTTPLSSLKLGELIKDIFPAGVVNIISDNNNLGPAITAHPGIAKVSFTGSTETGKRIMASGAGTSSDSLWSWAVTMRRSCSMTLMWLQPQRVFSMPHLLTADRAALRSSDCMFTRQFMTICATP